MRDLTAELKALHLYGMAEAWAELAGPEHGAGVDSSRWLLEHLLQAEATDRAMRSARYQITSAKLPIHRDLAGFDFDASPVDRKLVVQSADTGFTEQAHNVVLLGNSSVALPNTSFTSHAIMWPASRMFTYSACGQRERQTDERRSSSVRRSARSRRSPSRRTGDSARPGATGPAPTRSSHSGSTSPARTEPVRARVSAARSAP